MRRRTAVDTAVLGVGTLASGVLAYVFFAVATRTLGARDAAPISVLWTYWSAAAAVLTFPLQHWIIRTVQADGEGPLRRVLPLLWSGVGVLAVVVTGLAWLLRTSLFGRGDALFPCILGMVTLGSCGIGIVRGGLAARSRFVATAWALAGENALRAVGGVVAAVADLGTAAFAWVLAAGPLVGTLWPSSMRFADDGRDPGRVSPFGFLGSAAGGSLIAQVVLTGGPVILALLGGGPGEVTSLFAALALFRAPYVVALGLVTQVTGALTRLATQGRLDRLRAVLGLTILSALAGAFLGGGVGWAVGPDLLRLVFGPEVVVPPSSAAAIAVGTVIGLANLVLTLLLLARGRSAALLGCWLTSLAGGSLALGVPGPPFPRVVGAFVAAECVALVAMAVLETLKLRPSSTTTVQPPVDMPSSRDCG